MRIFFIGSVQFSKSCLLKMIEMGSTPVGVCTIEKSAFNSDHVDLTSICDRYNIPVQYSKNINSENIFKWIKSLKPDIIFCFGWSRLIKKQLLDLTPMGVIGYHPALLPKNRGRHPIIWALVLGLSKTGSTFFFMDEGADSGDILSQKVIPISPFDDANSLYKKVTKTAMSQLEAFIPELTAGSYHREPQSDNMSNLWRKRGLNDGKIDWRMSAKSINNLVRGLSRPYVGAHFEWKGKQIKVWNTEIICNDETHIEPGKIISKTKNGLVVKTGKDSLLLKVLEPEIELNEGEYL